MILYNREERRGCVVALAVQGVVRCMIVAADEQHREALRAVCIIVVLITPEDHVQAERSYVGEPAGTLLQI